MKNLKLKSIVFILIAISSIFLTSCQKEIDIPETELEELKVLDNFNENAKYPWTHVNPEGFTYIIYQAAVFCDKNGNGKYNAGVDDQIQIWTDKSENCECLLDQFISECDGSIIHLTECFQTTSQYPPKPEVCTI